MAILKVARLGHPILRQVAKPVPPEEIRSPEVQRLIDDMVETMREYDGAGLAANQVHTARQIAVIEVLANPRYPAAPHIPLTVVINPVPSPLSHRHERNKHWRGSREQADGVDVGGSAAAPPDTPTRAEGAPRPLRYLPNGCGGGVAARTARGRRPGRRTGAGGRQ